VTRFTIALALALALLVPLGPAQPQESAPPPPTPAPAPAPRTAASNDIFSGNVIELSSEAITVERTALLRDSVKRTFILDTQTTVEGKLKLRARVSVRFAADENGQFHALHIIVR
jgi:hypothetical protein